MPRTLSQEARQKAIDATLAIVAEEGISGFTVEGVDPPVIDLVAGERVGRPEWLEQVRQAMVGKPVEQQKPDLVGFPVRFVPITHDLDLKLHDQNLQAAEHFS